jgi:hypothetical protein
MLSFRFAEEFNPNPRRQTGQSLPLKNMKTKFTCNGHQSVRAESMQEAAEIFAAREALRRYGKRGYCRTCTEGAHAEDYRLAEYSAFIGYKSALNETTGRNINLTVRRA